MCSLCYCAMPLPVLIIRRVIYWDHRERKDQSKLIGTMCCSHLNLLTWKKNLKLIEKYQIEDSCWSKTKKADVNVKNSFCVIANQIIFEKTYSLPCHPWALPLHTCPEQWRVCLHTSWCVLCFEIKICPPETTWVKLRKKEQRRRKNL